jgi:two-component system, OmpR family, response regulator MprA
MRILVVEDDKELGEFLRRGLEEEGNRATLVHDGATAVTECLSQPYDVVVLDVMLPFLDGLEATRRIRTQGNRTPILLLTARDAPQDIVKGLDAGADDYLTKPFSFDVLLARLRARTRVARSRTRKAFQVGDLILDTELHEVKRAGRTVNLTRTEFSILECLLSASGRVVTRQALIDDVWGAERDIESNTLDAFMRFLRNKVDGNDQARLIHTVRGVGYCVREQQP